MILTPDAIKSRLKNLGIRSDKFLGQHFLVDEAVLNAIIAQTKAIIQPNDLIIEVGPGLGVLTKSLLELRQSVITIERDPILAASLGAYVNNPHLTIIQNDILRLLETNPGFPLRFKRESLGQILQMDVALAGIDDSICSDNPGRYTDWLFVANIPYGITSPLLTKLIHLETPPRHIIVLMQKEVAERLAARPGNPERGLLTLVVELAGSVKIIQTVPASAFWPAPKVESALVHIDLTQSAMGLTDGERQQLFRVVTAGFSAKRKQLQNSLSGGLQLPVEDVRKMLEAAAINPTRRAETLTLHEWHILANALQKQKNSK